MSLASSIIGAAVAICVVAAVTVLGWHGTLDGQTVASLYGAIIGGGVVGAGHALKSGGGS